MEKGVTPLRFGSLPGNGQFLQFIRFGIVGIVGTAIYLMIAISLPALSSFIVSPTAAAMVASVMSVLVSYMGHHKFTFTKVGQHSFYLPRFLILSVLLSCAVTVGTHLLTEVFSIEYRYAAVAVAVTYPIASFSLNHMVIFRDRR